MRDRVFYPIASVALALTTTSARVAIPGTIEREQKRTVRLANPETAGVFIAFGSSTVTAAVDGTSLYLPAGAVELFEPPVGVTHVAGVLASGTGTLYITAGEGV